MKEKDLLEYPDLDAVVREQREEVIEALREAHSFESFEVVEEWKDDHLFCFAFEAKTDTGKNLQLSIWWNMDVKTAYRAECQVDKRKEIFQYLKEELEDLMEEDEMDLGKALLLVKEMQLDFFNVDPEMLDPEAVKENGWSEVQLEAVAVVAKHIKLITADHEKALAEVPQGFPYVFASMEKGFVYLVFTDIKNLPEYVMF